MKINKPSVSDTSSRGMSLVDALRVLAEARGSEQVVITNQGASRIWPKISQHELDFHYNPSTMGGAIPLTLGMALADSSREYLVVTGDGALLMSLGSLVSVVGAGVTNVTVIVLDNGLYEVTGGQKTPASEGFLDYCEVARATGFPSVKEFNAIDALRLEISPFLSSPGPRLASLVVDSVHAEDLQSPPIPMADQLGRLRLSLARPMAQ